MGNHDFTDGGGSTAYFNYFTLPNNERYYDYVQGPVHFFVIDSYSADGALADLRAGNLAASRIGRLDLTLEDCLHAPSAILIFHHSWFRNCHAMAVRSLGCDGRFGWS